MYLCWGVMVSMLIQRPDQSLFIKPCRTPKVNIGVTEKSFKNPGYELFIMSCFKTKENTVSLISTPISVGELLDKVTILEIKQDKIKAADKLKNVRHELHLLQSICEQENLLNDDVKAQKQALKAVNLRLWAIEDDIRIKEKKGEFDEDFIQLARRVYFENDDRAAIKKQINLMTGSQLIEEKSYQDYR